MKKDNSFYEKFIEALKLGKLGKNRIRSLILNIKSSTDISVMNANNDQDGGTILHAAVRYQNIEAIGLLMDRGIDIYAHDNFGQTALYLAAKNCYKSVCNLLIKKGDHINLALAISAKFNDVRAADLLINKGADVNLALLCLTPHEALHIGFNFLINKGANVDIALNMAAERTRKIDEFSFLISKGANINTKGSSGYTPLQISAFNDNFDLAKFLIEKKADVNIQATNGWTALHYATYRGNLDIVRLLISNGANVNAADEAGYTPLHHAAFMGNEDVIDLLLSNNASVNAKDILGRTASTLAAQKGFISIVKLLVDHCIDKRHKEMLPYIQNNAKSQNNNKQAVMPQNLLIKNNALDEVKLPAHDCIEVNSKDKKNGYTAPLFTYNKSTEMPCIQDHTKPQSNYTTCAIAFLLLSIALVVPSTLTSSFILSISVACVLVVTAIGIGLYDYKASQYQQMSNEIPCENQLNQISLEQQGKQISPL